LDPYGDEAPGFPALDVRADTLGKKEQNTASAFQGAEIAQHTNDQRITKECEKTPLGTSLPCKIDPPRVRGYDMSHNTNRVDNKFAEPTDRPVILTDAGQPIDQAAPSTAAGEVRQGAAVHPLVAEEMRINAFLARGRERAKAAKVEEVPAALPDDINPACVRVVEFIDPTIWPEGGGVPIDRYTFTEDKALELGIVFENERGKIQVRIHEAASYIMERIAFANIRTGDNVELHYYDRGTYRKLAEQMIGLAAEQLLGQYANNKNVAEIVGKIKRSYPPVRTDDGNPEGWLCLKNGYFNIYTRELEPHHPGRIFTGQLPVTYDPGKKCKHFGRFLLEVTDLPTDPQAILELMGYCLLPDYRFQYFFTFLGEGANGKGTLTKVITAILGGDHVSNVPLQDFSENRFSAVALLGKMVNISGDLDAKSLKNTGIIKMLTGEDDIRADRKGTSAVTFRNRAKIICSSNEPTHSYDDSYGFIRRHIFFLFPHQFDGDKRDEALLDKLTTEEEKSAIFNEMLDGLDRLLKNRAFTGREDPRAEAERYLAMQNSAKVFLDNFVISDEDYSSGNWLESAFREGKTSLYNHYKEWCEDNGFFTKRDREFAAEVRKAFPNVREGRFGRHNLDDPNARCWIGIRYDPGE
jgi:P4 family phage/plasmid primase-like protien